MSDFIGYTTSAILIIAACSACAAVGAAFLRKWRLARALARGAVLSALVMIPVGIAILVAAFSKFANADASSKATHLARGISESMNVGALILPALLLGVPAWIIAARRLRNST